MCPSMYYLAFGFSVPASKDFKCTLSVCSCVHKYAYFVYVQALLFVCAQRSGWTSVCSVSMHESWDTSLIFLNLIDQKTRAKCNLSWDIGIRMAVGDGSVAESRQWRRPYLYMRIQNTIYTEILHLLLFRNQGLWSC